MKIGSGSILWIQGNSGGGGFYRLARAHQVIKQYLLHPLGEQVSISSTEEKACMINNSSFFNAYLQTPEPCVLLQGISHSNQILLLGPIGFWP